MLKSRAKTSSLWIFQNNVDKVRRGLTTLHVRSSWYGSDAATDVRTANSNSDCQMVWSMKVLMKRFASCFQCAMNCKISQYHAPESFKMQLFTSTSSSYLKFLFGNGRRPLCKFVLRWVHKEDQEIALGCVINIESLRNNTLATLLHKTQSKPNPKYWNESDKALWTLNGGYVIIEMIQWAYFWN